jgi:hypothetical protein
MVISNHTSHKILDAPCTCPHLEHMGFKVGLIQLVSLLCENGTLDGHWPLQYQAFGDRQLTRYAY